jgi:HK97 family phage major capsid protein
MSEKGRSRGLSFSSEKAVVPRWYGGEILDHSPKSVRMDFMNSGRAPFLMYHDQRQQIGVIEKANIGGDKIGHAIARFGRTASATDALSNVDDGIFVNTSVGYRVHEMILDSEKDGEPIYRVTDWEPYEASIVGVPADTNVGVGRAAVLPTDAGPSGETTEADPEARVERASSSPEPILKTTTTQVATTKSATTTTEVQTTAIPAATRGVTSVTTETTAAAGTSAEPKKITGIEAEKERKQAIENICLVNKIDARVQGRWIEDGTRITDVLKEVVEIQAERSKRPSTAAASLGLSGSETKRYSLFRAIRALRFGGQNQRFLQEAAFEIECSQTIGKRFNREMTTSILVPSEILQRPFGDEAARAMQERAMATTPGSKGGYMVNVQNMGFIDILRNRSVSMRMGARVLSGLQGNVTFPRQTGKVTVTWQAGEGTSITAADQALGQLSMTPKTCIAITDVSEQLLAQASPSAEAFVMADLASDVAIDGVDAAVINGTGGAQPLGIKNTTGVATGQDSATATYAKVLAFISTAGAANAIRGNPGWVTNTVGASVLMQRQRFTSTDTPLWTGNMLDGQVGGFNAMSSEQLASGNLIFGSWDEVVIGEWGVLELSTDNGGTRFNTAQVGIRAMWMVDVLLRYPQAFVVSTNLS